MDLSISELRTNDHDRMAILRAGLAVMIVSLSVMVYQIILLDKELGFLFASRKWTAALGLGVSGAVLAMVLLITSWTAWGLKIGRWFGMLLVVLNRLGRLNLFLFLIPVAAFSYLLLGPQAYFFDNLSVRLSSFGLAVFAGAILLMASGLLPDLLVALAASWLLVGSGYKIAAFIPDVSTYPFSLGWSEASRYYYASLFFSRQVYGVSAQPSVLHPTRYMLQAIPFLISGLPLWFHRLWQVVLWLGITGGTAYLLAKRLSISNVWARFLFVLWAALFLLQGPVYYHLLVSALVVLWWFDSRSFWKSLLVVLVASAWAGISRINWAPVPGLLAASIYFLEVRLGPADKLKPEKTQRLTGSGATDEQLSDRAIAWKGLVAYFLEPAVWIGSGTLVAFGSQALYVLWSRADPSFFASSLSSDLLWYRLLPNPTFPLGILPGILIVSAPLAIVLVKGMEGLHPLRKLAEGSILLVLFLGGVVVSTKIGGGSNLHNMDAFLTLLFVLGAYVFFGRIVPDVRKTGMRRNFSPILLGFAVIVPVVLAVSQGGPLKLSETQRAEAALTTLRDLTQDAAGQNGEVLFISQRHLLTFGYIQGVPLVEKYENVFLMEMAMAGNERYLNTFYNDIRNHRFSLIISDPLGARIKGSEYPFGEENDVWIERITRPLLEYYQRKELLKSVGIEVLEPRR
ncbi:MAG TPA: hypothetical protein VE136_09205 [Anaerolineales bacterium]|nr:hypothetical protein [Anaerolineales bacterium]